MRKRARVLIAGVATGLLAVGMTTAAIANPTTNPLSAVPSGTDAKASVPDELVTPEMAQEKADKQEALNLVASGQAAAQTRGSSTSVQLKNGKFVEVSAPKVAKIFTILVEFGDTKMWGGEAGPKHNQIPSPDRNWDGNATDDNSTAWESDYSQSYFQTKLFSKTRESMSHFYLAQSGGKYTVDGFVTNWVTLPYNEARYGNNDHQNSGYQALVKDSAKAWYDQQIAAGRSAAEVNAQLKDYDQWDRLDADGDGNFDEPDGQLDHVQLIHAGAGEEAGGGAQGVNAVWSHSSSAGAAGSAAEAKFGDSGIRIGRYTTEPENGGLGVFAHEYGHDIGLPDYYDTVGGDNGTGFWTIMSGGSWLNRGDDRIGDKPGGFGPQEKLFLGWLNYDTVETNETESYHILGAAADPMQFKQATMVKLPNQDLTTEFTKPFAGAKEWWSGSADDLDATLTRDINLAGATTASITAKVNYDTEKDYDYFFGEVSTDGGTTWTTLGTPIDGKSAGWVDLNFDLSAYAGQAIKFRYHTTTDGGLHMAGTFIDNVSVVKNGVSIFSDDVEGNANGWTAKGYTQFTGTLHYAKAHYYLVENRQFTSYDTTLKSGPYNFGNAAAQPNWVDRFPMEPGVVIWYVNFAYENNNTSVPGQEGHGAALPVDAHPAPVLFQDGSRLANRRQSWDGSFGNIRTRDVTFRKNGAPTVVERRAGVPEFNDTNPNQYWDASNPWNSVKVAGAGVKIKVLIDGHTNVMPAVISVTR